MRLRLPAFALLAATPALAADPAATSPEAPGPVSGHVEFYLGHLATPFPMFGDTLIAVGGAARVNLRLANAWNVQGDLTVDGLTDGSDFFAAYDGALHAYRRNPQSYAFGAFVEASRYTVLPLNRLAGGVEAQAYFADGTLYGQAWYGQQRYPGDPSYMHEFGVRAVARYAPTDNLRFDGELALLRYQLSDSPAYAPLASAAVQANCRFTGTPATLFARYQVDRLGGENFHKALVGLRLTFGSPTLRDEDLSGATMDVFRPAFPLPVGGV